MRAQRSLDAGVAGHGLAADTPHVGVLELVVNVKEPAALALLSLAFLGMAAAHAATRRVETGFLNRSLVMDAAEYRYQVYVPRGFQPSSKWPVILALHGEGEYGENGLRQTVFAVAGAIRLHPERFPAIVVFPQAHVDGTPGWQGRGGRAALAAVDEAVAEFSGDSSRIYITGYSAGGNGAWFLASRYPDRFAAAVVVCGFVSEFRGGTTNILYPAPAPGSASDPFAALARRMADLPIWIFHGDADPTVSVSESRQMAAALKSIGSKVLYTEFPGVGHDAWSPAYDRADLFEWMLKQRRR